MGNVWGALKTGLRYGSGLGVLDAIGGGTRADESRYGGVDNQGRIAGRGGLVDTANRQGMLSTAQFNERGQRMQDLEGRLGRLASGEESISALQLQQNAGRNIAQQQAMAASARPGNSAMAARIGAQNAASIGSGLAGQQAIAGIQERDAANTALSGLLMGGRQQDLQSTLGQRGLGMQGLLGVEGNRTARYGADLGVPTRGEQYLGAIQGLAGAAAVGGGG